MTVSGTENEVRKLGWGWIWGAMTLWTIASVAGSLGESLPRRVSFSTPNGAPIDICASLFPVAVEDGRARATEWCTVDSVIGPSLPTDVRRTVGSIPWTDGIDWSDFLTVLVRPDLWLTLGVGGAALLLLFGFARGTGTLRAGLAVAISTVFLGLLLFPQSFTLRIPADMRSELVTAWQWLILFYFGSEAAVQAWKVARPNGADVTGDMPDKKAQSKGQGELSNKPSGQHIDRGDKDSESQ